MVEEWAEGSQRSGEGVHLLVEDNWQTMVRCADHGSTYIFSDDLLQSRTEDIPRENFDIFFNVSRFWIWKSHDGLEEFLASRLVLRNGDRSETFEITSDTVLFFNRESSTDKRFKKINGIDRGDKTLVFILSEDTRNDDGLLRLWIILLGERPESSKDGCSLLSSPKLDQSPSVHPLFLRPAR